MGVSSPPWHFCLLAIHVVCVLSQLIFHAWEWALKGEDFVCDLLIDIVCMNLCKSKDDSKSWNTFFFFIIFFCWGIGYKFIFRSANIGVFICLKCCGVHRSLGTHISKVIAPKSPFTIKHKRQLVAYSHMWYDIYWRNLLHIVVQLTKERFLASC